MSTPLLRDFHPAPRTGNVVLLLNEVRHALERLLRTAEGTTIDLSTIPMAPQEQAELDAALGLGEVTATVMASGPSEVQETAYPGVWRLTHKTDDGRTLGRYIEIATIPAILLAQTTDMSAGLERLTRQLTPTSEHEVTP